MKQHVTEHDLSQLSEKGKERLRQWFEPVETMFLSEDRKTLYTNKGFISVNLQLPLLSIGQMIEFLDEHRTEDPPRKEYWGVAHVKDEYWYVGEDGGDELSNMGDFQKKELCDALWQACKEVLESQ